MRSSVAAGALRDAACQVGAVEADVNRAALEVPPAVLEASRPLEGADPAMEQLAHAVTGALGDLAAALLALRRGLEAAAEADAQPVRTSRVREPAFEEQRRTG